MKEVSFSITTIGGNRNLHYVLRVTSNENDKVLRVHSSKSKSYIYRKLDELSDVYKRTTGVKRLRSFS